MQSPNIKEAKVLDEHKLLIKFTNDEEKVFDMKLYLHYPVFQPLNDLKEFNNFFIEGNNWMEMWSGFKSGHVLYRKFACE